MLKPFIMVAPNGARRVKTDHAQIPLSVFEITATARACQSAGADGIHVHVRDDTGKHSLDAGRYLEILKELSLAVPGMRAQITTESAGIFELPEQLACLEQVKPSWASISVREVAKAPELADRLYGTCTENATEVQHILYDTDDVALLQDWQSKGIVRPNQNSVIYVLGRYTKGQVSNPDDLHTFLDAHPERKNWMVCAFGAQEHECLQKAAAAGGDLRVGFENSLHDSNDQLHNDNASSVAALVRKLNTSQLIPAEIDNGRPMSSINDDLGKNHNQQNN